MKNYRTWGEPPYRIAVIHGGPGAVGEMAEMADELSKNNISILEPQQTALSVDGQVEELCENLKSHAIPPVTLIGHSWGAMLIFIVASRYSELVNKLILVCSGVFEAKYAVGIDAVREERLSDAEKKEINKLWGIIRNSTEQNNDKLLARIGELAAKADTYSALPEKHYEMPKGLKVNADMFKKIMPEVTDLRKSGRLLSMGENINCPVIAIHGNYDSHLVEGIKEPLSRTLTKFKLIELEKCGHEPWRERYAREKFFQILKDEIKV